MLAVYIVFSLGVLIVQTQAHPDKHQTVGTFGVSSNSPLADLMVYKLDVLLVSSKRRPSFSSLQNGFLARLFSVPAACSTDSTAFPHHPTNPVYLIQHFAPFLDAYLHIPQCQVLI